MEIHLLQNPVKPATNRLVWYTQGMEWQKTLGLAVLVLAVFGIGFYAATRPAPSTAPETTQSPVLPGGSYTEHAQYYDVTANYATSTPLAGRANAAAVALMQKFVADTIAQFKTDGNFANLTQKDITMMGFDQGRKEKLQILYLFGSSAHTISYIFTTYMDTLGAHGNTTFKTFTFDTSTGALLSLSGVFLPGANYLGTLSSMSRAQLPAMLRDAANSRMIEDGTTPDEANFQNFFFDNRDFVVLFDPYQVAPYAAGPQTVRIPLEELSNVMKPEYRP